MSCYNPLITIPFYSTSSWYNVPCVGVYFYGTSNQTFVEMNKPGRQEIFVYVWEYVVKEEAQADFERIYGPQGDWVQLFRKGEGYLGTKLHQDVANGRRYLTTDYWVSPVARDAFRQQFAQEFKELDQLCDALTEKEVFLGDFVSRSTRPWPVEM